MSGPVSANGQFLRLHDFSCPAEPLRQRDSRTALRKVLTGIDGALSRARSRGAMDALAARANRGRSEGRMEQRSRRAHGRERYTGDSAKNRSSQLNAVQGPTSKYSPTYYEP
jgi:hypothetical protein